MRDPYLYYTADFICKSMVDEARKRCALWGKSSFSFFSALRFVFYEKYENCNGAWNIVGEDYQAQAAAVVSNINAAIRALPEGVEAELRIEKDTDQRDDPRFEGKYFERRMICSIIIKVTSSFLENNM